MRGFLLLAVFLPTVGLAQNELAGKDKFPEFRTFSALPGSTFGVLEDGKISMFGAMGISSPVAHSLGQDQWAFGIGNTSLRGGLRFFNDRNALADGTAWGMTGIGTRAGNFTVSGMLLSTARDSVLNLHFTPKTEWDNVVVGVGVQDAFSTGGSSGEAIDLPNGGGISRSFYGVATLKLWEGAYASAGLGSRRFAKGFGNFSFNADPKLKLVAEHDGFNWNFGASYKVAEFRAGSRMVSGTVFIGQIRAKYWTWALNFSF